MTSLADLFPAERDTTSPTAKAPEQDAAAKLEQLVGARRAAPNEREADADAGALKRRVDAAVADAAPTTVTASASARGKRRARLRIDRMNVIVVALAVIALVCTGVFAFVQSARATPAATAAQALQEDQADLASAERGLASMRERLIGSIDESIASATTVRAGLVALDPAIVDAAGRDVTVAAVDTYLQLLQNTTIPEVPAVYVAAEVDPNSLASVADAINTVQLRSSEVDAVAAEVRQARDDVQSAKDAYQQQLGAFAATFPVMAAAEVAANSLVAQEYVDAVNTAAAVAAATSAESVEGQQAMLAYQDAVRAMREEQLRAAEVDDGNSEEPWYGDGGWDDEPSDGGADPGTDVPAPDPDPVLDPEEPTDPIPVG